MVPAAEFFNRSIDSVMLYMHSYKNKTYKREDIYTSFTCKSWGPPIGHQLLCGTAISVQPERGFMLYSVFLSHSITAVECVSQRSDSIIRRQKIWLLALGNLNFPRKLHLLILGENVKFHNQEEGSKNHFTAGERSSLPSDTPKGYGPTQQSTWELYLASSMPGVLELCCRTACMFNSQYRLKRLEIGRAHV